MPPLSIVQATLAGSNIYPDANDPFLGGYVDCTATGSFASTTTAGNTLICICWANATAVSGESVLPYIIGGGGFGPVSASYWTLAGDEEADNESDSGLPVGYVSVWFITNAPSISSSEVFSVTARAVEPYHVNIATDFALIELAGGPNSQRFNLLAQSGSRNTAASGTVNAGSFTTVSYNSTVLTAYASYGTNLTAGTGFTLGPEAVDAVASQSQYIISVPQGTIVNPAFNGSNQYWAATAIEFIQAMTVTSVSQSCGPLAGGNTVTITGVNFDPNNVVELSVQFGSTTATSITVVNNTTITCKVPAGTGTVGITVYDIFGYLGTYTLPNAYTYEATPTITSIVPGSGTTAGGTPVTITGTNFTAGSTVTFGGTSATSIVVVSSTSITCVTPAHAAGTVSVVVTSCGGTATGSFTYTTGPTTSNNYVQGFLLGF